VPRKSNHTRAPETPNEVRIPPPAATSDPALSDTQNRRSAAPITTDADDANDTGSTTAGRAQPLLYQ
jgi:hypothetical protein